jgi:thiamine monophosphate synthase
VDGVALASAVTQATDIAQAVAALQQAVNESTPRNFSD